MVLFSGVLSAHVFPGRIEDGRLVFGRELGRGRAVPIADLRAWFPVRLETVNEEQRFATAAREVINDLGFTVRRAGRYDAPFTLHTVASKGWLLHYYFAGATLVPVMDYRSAWPHTEGVHPLDECYREQVLIDADHDRTPDVLSVHVGQPFEWLRPPPPERAPTPDKHRRDVEHGRLRAGIVHGLGERGGGANRVLVQFDEPVKLDRRPERDAPISVHEVPVFGRDPGRVRYCVYFRPRRVGFFFEVASIAAEAQHARRFEAWRRRGERRLEMFPHYAACDQEVCEHDIPHDLEVCHDAAELFRRALPFAADAPQKARIWRDVARCHVAAGEIDEARRAYERFVMTGRRIEPLQPPPPQLAALFADEAFRALHRGWSQRLPVVPTDKL
ncbi:MAG: tetratricopeptide repeat protein, partial [Planctomycetes bacterium]|nr:tetratricopeptide repeat protein [Planctomycetota bacterium]